MDLEPQIAAAVRGELPVSELPSFFGRAFTAVWAAVEEAGASVAGPPFGYYPSMPTDVVVVEAGFPVSTRIEPSGEVHPLELPGGRAVVTVHVGPYETMAQTYTELQQWMADQGFQPAGAAWECYLSDPQTEPDPAKWNTRIVWPVL